MGKYSKISWCDHTWNPWWGCRRVSPGCENCYAERLANRFSESLWKGNHRSFNDKHWNDLDKWNKERWLECSNCYWRGPEKDTTPNLFGEPNCPACDCGLPLLETKQRVFIGSMCDLFEHDSSLDEQRDRVFELCDRTPNLIKLLLTKRAEWIINYLPDRWRGSNFPENVWIGISAESQGWFESRFLWERKLRAAFRIPVIFLSAEPLLGMIDIEKGGVLLNWVIIGAESGPGARRIKNDAIENLVDQCLDRHIPVYVKQAYIGDTLVQEAHELPKEIRYRMFPPKFLNLAKFEG